MSVGKVFLFLVPLNLYTELGERAGSRLRELAPAARGRPEAGFTQPIGPTLSPSTGNTIAKGTSGEARIICRSL